MTIQQRFRLTADNQLLMHQVLSSIAQVKPWPTSPEFRYLRVLNVGDPITDLRRFVRIWCIALPTGHYVYCFFLIRRLLEQGDGHQGLADKLMQLLTEVNARRV